MGIVSKIIGGVCDVSAYVFNNNSLKVSVVPVPSKEQSVKELQQNLPFVSKFENGSGSSMNIDGSSTPVIFHLQSQPDRIITISEMRFVIHSANVDITSTDSRRFGAATSPNTPLTNGIKFQFINSETVNLFAENVTVLGDFYNYSGQNGGGVGVNASIISDSGGIGPGVDYFMAVYQLTFPVVLFPGTTDVLEITIQDDLTSLDFFECFAFGKQEVL